MANIDSLKIGTELDNAELQAIFKCSPQGGMRRSHETNTLVIVSNRIRSIYTDRHDEETSTLYYTGMGTEGNQSLSFAQNRTLAESNSNGVTVHWFEVLEDRVYTYRGIVTLIAPPYTEDQPDANKDLRQVYVFPLKLASSNPYITKKKSLDLIAEQKERQARQLSDSELEQRAKRSRNKADTRKTQSVHYERDPWVKEYTLRKANGICQLCNEPAPFNKRNGKPYLETHHVTWLAKGGDDSINNTVALCPNCHRKMHVVNSEIDKNYLRTLNH